jgi:enterochelin esterase family protein
LLLPRPPVDRIEYKFSVQHRSGEWEHILDPTNPRRVPGPFGDRSVIELPGYQRPGWVNEPSTRRRTRPIDLPVASLGPAQIAGHLWSAAGTRSRERLPLLVVHDGPEYARLARLVDYLEHAATSNAIPPMRAALLAPIDGERNEHYAASPAYAAALVDEIVPMLDAIAPTPTGRRGHIGMGASLGALAMLHAHRQRPGLFAGLFLQSGSFFQLVSDRQEADFPNFQRIGRFVRGVHARRRWADPVPVTITAGLGEENLGNNRAMARALQRQGYPLQLVEGADAHTWVGWRDVFHPHLAELVVAALR